MLEFKMRRSYSSGSPYEPQIGFCRAVRVGPIVSVAGTAPIGEDGLPFAPGDPAAQTRRCIQIVRTALESLGARLENVVRTRTYLTRREDWEAVGRAHGEFFGDIRPASTMIVVKELLDPAWLVEIEADAVIDSELLR